MKRTIVVVPDSEDAQCLRVVAEADDLAGAKVLMRELPDGVYSIASFQEHGVEVRPPLSTFRKVVVAGQTTVTRTRLKGKKQKRSATAPAS